MLLKACRIVVTKWLPLLPLIIVLAACNKSNKPSLRVFASPEYPSTTFMEAAKSGDQNALLAIFGVESKDIIFSCDPVQDTAVADKFNAAPGLLHQWLKIPDC